MKRIVILISILLLYSCSSLGNPSVSTKSITQIPLPVRLTDTSTPTYTEIRPTTTSTPTKTFTLTPSLTLAPPITKTRVWSGPIPGAVLERASVTGMTPEEIMDTYLIIHTALGANDPSQLADLILYPLIGCHRCGGRIVKTPDDFIKLYHDQMDEATRKKLYSQKPEELFMNYQGTMFGDGEIWFGKWCSIGDHKSCNIYIGKFLSNCLHDENEEAIVKVDETNFVFGKYAPKTYETVGGTFLEEKQVNQILSAQIEIYPNRYLADPNEWYGSSCESATIEFCSEVNTKVTDASAIGRMNILCGEEIVKIFDIKSETELIMYIDGFHFFLEHISP